MIERSDEASRQPQPQPQPQPTQHQGPLRSDEVCQSPQSGHFSIRLNSLELAFLDRLSLNDWTSPPVFDHCLLDRVVDAGYVAKHAAPGGVHYEITDCGRAAVIAVTS